MTKQQLAPGALDQTKTAGTAKKVLGLLGKTLAVLFLAVLVMGLLAAWMGQMDGTGIESAMRLAAQIKRWGLIVQSAVLALIVLRWKALVDWARARNIVKAHEYQQVLALRLGFALFGLAYLILVPIGPTTLWRLFVGS